MRASRSSIRFSGFAWTSRYTAASVEPVCAPAGKKTVKATAAAQHATFTDAEEAQLTGRVAMNDASPPAFPGLPVRRSFAALVRGANRMYKRCHPAAYLLHSESDLEATGIDIIPDHRLT